MSDARALRLAGQEPGVEVAVADETTRWADHVDRALEFLRRRALGEYEIDEFGFDRELTDGVLLAALAAMVQLAIHDAHPNQRHLRPLGADVLFDMPFVGMFARKAGATLACNPDAERLLRSGELVGRGGFVAAALKVGVPIVPCSVVGSEEIYPMLGNVKVLARMLGLPYFPVTPTFPWLGPLGMVPLPSKWVIEFGEPIDAEGFGESAPDDPMLVFEITDRVRETIQHNLYRMLVRRRGIFR